MKGESLPEWTHIGGNPDGRQGGIFRGSSVVGNANPEGGFVIILWWKPAHYLEFSRGGMC